MFPDIDFFLHRPLLVESPMCSLAELQDGTYSINDLALLNDIIDYKIDLKNKQLEEEERQLALQNYG